MLRSGRELELRVQITVGESEIDYLGILPVVGDDDVRRLEVPVDDLTGMNVAQGITYFHGDFPEDGRIMFFFEEIFKSPS